MKYEIFASRMIFSLDSSMQSFQILDLKPEAEVIQQFIQVFELLNMSLKILFQLNQIFQFLREVHQLFFQKACLLIKRGQHTFEDQFVK